MLVVISGGPASGKTTLVDALGAAGWCTVPEAAIQIIAERNESMGVEAQKAWRRANPIPFQRLVIARQVELEERALAGLPPGEAAFLDRGRADGLAYLRHFGQEAPAEIVETIRAQRYDRVFLLETLPEVADRGATGRTSDRAASLALCARLEEVYRELGYEPVPVPVAPVAERTRLVLGTLGLPDAPPSPNPRGRPHRAR